MSDLSTRRVTAGVLGLLLGFIGVHKFYLGYTKEGLIMLLLAFFSCGAVSGTIGFIEGILYLAKSDADFAVTYGPDGRKWF